MVAWLKPTPGGVRIRVHVQPRASTSSLQGLHGDALKIRLAAPPVDGAANEALVGFLADILKRPRSAVRLTRGAASRRKTVEVTGIDPAEAARRLGLGATPLSGQY
jgi:uncharacterized protein (TIGR00251 family)